MERNITVRSNRTIDFTGITRIEVEPREGDPGSVLAGESWSRVWLWKGAECIDTFVPLSQIPLVIEVSQ